MPDLTATAGLAARRAPFLSTKAAHFSILSSEGRPVRAPWAFLDHPNDSIDTPGRAGLSGLTAFSANEPGLEDRTNSPGGQNELGFGSDGGIVGLRGF